jgi:hypothetical protein
MWLEIKLNQKIGSWGPLAWHLIMENGQHWDKTVVPDAQQLI